MSGQPQIPMWLEFDVTNLEVTADPGFTPSNVIKKGDSFNLTATFTGGGGLWTLLEAISELAGVDVKGMATFSVEGIGADADEEDFGPEEVILSTGGTYEVTTTVAPNELDVGVYEVACRVTFEVHGAAGGIVYLPGLTGHYKGLGPNQEVLSIYQH